MTPQQQLEAPSVSRSQQKQWVHPWRFLEAMLAFWTRSEITQGIALDPVLYWADKPMARSEADLPKQWGQNSRRVPPSMGIRPHSFLWDSAYLW